MRDCMYHALHLSVSPCMRRWCQLAMLTSHFSLTGSLDISTFRLSTSKCQPTCLPLASTPPSHLPHVTPLVCLTLLCDMSLTHSLTPSISPPSSPLDTTYASYHTMKYSSHTPTHSTPSSPLPLLWSAALFPFLSPVCSLPCLGTTSMLPRPTSSSFAISMAWSTTSSQSSLLLLILCGKSPWQVVYTDFDRCWS